ncbi:hypothetical protein [Fluviicola taffensis]|uniref:hypothetical protein n=1 Tax=Fluviicola taffensis TaxID=191579 RepID=UPI003137F34C
MSIQSDAFNYLHEAFEADDDHEEDENIQFDDDNEDQSELAMAKAYDLSGEETYATAKAYDDDDDFHPSADLKEEPADRNNPFSDVFQVDDHLFEEDTNSRKDNAIEDEDINDQFARDLQAVLSGQKSLAQLTEYADDTHAKEEQTKPTNDPSVQQVEEKMVKDEAVFEQLALDMNRLQTFQLGDVHLEEIFDSVDADLLKETSQKQKLEDVVTEAAMTLDGMEMAEDFEYMESLAESNSDNQQRTETNNNYEDAEIIVDEVETNESAEL